MMQWGSQAISGTVGAAKYVSKCITLNISYSNTVYIPFGMHKGGNQFNVTNLDAVNPTKVNSFDLSFRNINTGSNADLVKVLWFTIGKA